jgi:NADH:ubiquinone oxidoreductase subunit H
MCSRTWRIVQPGRTVRKSGVARRPTYAGPMHLPSAPLAAWGNAWLSGHVGLDDQLGWAWTLLKVFGVAFVIIWVRVTFPRLRVDQVQRLCWQVLVPLALAQLVLTAAVRLVI